MLDGRAIRLRNTPRMRHGHLTLSINEAIALLGGSSWYDQAHDRMFLFTAKARPRHPYATLDMPSWIVREKADLRAAEKAADPSQSWRENPALVVRNGTHLPAALKGKDAVQKIQPTGAVKPSVTLTAGTASAQFTVIEKTATTARVRALLRWDNVTSEEIYLLERPFGRWWYVVGIEPRPDTLPA